MEQNVRKQEKEQEARGTMEAIAGSEKRRSKELESKRQDDKRWSKTLECRKKNKKQEARCCLSLSL